MDTKSLESIIGENVAKYRGAAGFTQSQLAERVGISTAFISRVERGQKMMKVHTLLNVAKALHVSCDALLNQNIATVSLENIRVLLDGLPDEYVIGIEKLVRVCIEQFDPKQKSPSEEG
ncbi:MAG: helix-turn-helix transcriptional regulator [Clostridiales bacterium]|nr:helix-turn-helix transcriptional regulator [Clostridiales bacterium]